jgi:Sulfotransferase domain
MKIIGIGLPKTGTKTLGECCRAWKLRHKSWDFHCFDILQESLGLYFFKYLRKKRKIDRIMSHVEKFDSFDDCPWYLLYREIDERFPGSKFILTRRTSVDVWLESYCKWADRFGPKAVLRTRKHVFGYEKPKHHEKEYAQVYLAHNEAAREYFKDKPDQMIELCWEEGDGWPELSAFLGFEIPATPFPHLNLSSLNKIDV